MITNSQNTKDCLWLASCEQEREFSIMNTCLVIQKNYIARHRNILRLAVVFHNCISVLKVALRLSLMLYILYAYQRFAQLSMQIFWITKHVFMIENSLSCSQEANHKQSFVFWEFVIIWLTKILNS
jgi:hypothetical protein